MNDKGPPLFDLSLQTIQASALTLITLAEEPHCPSVPTSICVCIYMYIYIEQRYEQQGAFVFLTVSLRRQLS